MKLVGYRKSDFIAKDGTEVKGYNLYFSEPITQGGKGLATDNIYLSENKLSQMGIDLDKFINHSVLISYNRWGKAQTINIIE